MRMGLRYLLSTIFVFTLIVPINLNQRDQLIQEILMNRGNLSLDLFGRLFNRLRKPREDVEFPWACGCTCESNEGDLKTTVSDIPGSLPYCPCVSDSDDSSDIP